MLSHGPRINKLVHRKRQTRQYLKLVISLLGTIVRAIRCVITINVITEFVSSDLIIKIVIKQQHKYSN